MAGSLVALGEIWELRLHGSLAGQSIITVQHLRVSAITPPVTNTALNIALQAYTKAAGGFGFTALPALPDSWSGLSVQSQRVFPLTERSANSSSTWNVVGAAPGADTANVAQVVTRRTERAGRSEVSTGHLPCPTTADAIIAGELTVAQKALLTQWLGAQYTTVTLLAGSVSLEPVIWHRGIPPEGRFYSIITSAVIQPTVRVMRRRTVGLGI